MQLLISLLAALQVTLTLAAPTASPSQYFTLVTSSPPADSNRAIAGGISIQTNYSSHSSSSSSFPTSTFLLSSSNATDFTGNFGPGVDQGVVYLGQQWDGATELGNGEGGDVMFLDKPTKYDSVFTVHFGPLTPAPYRQWNHWGLVQGDDGKELLGAGAWGGAVDASKWLACDGQGGEGWVVYFQDPSSYPLPCADGISLELEVVWHNK